ncbi:MAG: HEAT repeat domain-containing protein [Dehalococcoidia bacterium]|nr:HEAT repeat domain-containing protein [Dehalococcoidia bacterium]MSQ16411.1 HEAT repeat domain-containing protein [Dehalococcoidia bacterium]
MSLQHFLDILVNPSAEFTHAEMAELTDLSPSELGAFAKVWFGLPAPRQCQLISSLVGLAEDNAEMDFFSIFKICLKSDSEEVLSKAMEGLWEYEDRSTIPALVQVLQSKKSPEVRAAAANALGKFATLAQDGKILAKDGNLVRDSLMKVLQDASEHLEVRRRSLEAVAPFNGGEVRKFVQWAYKSQEPKLKSSAIFAMGRTGETSWLSVLIKELQSREPVVRYETAQACGELGDDAVAPHLIPLLHDDDYQVQLAGISSLGKVGGPLAKRALLRCIKEGDATLEEAARAALENIEFLEDPMAFPSEP